MPITTSRESWAPEFRKDVDFRYSFVKKYCKDSVVLDAGCGIGYGTRLLTTTASTVLGIDRRIDSIRYASEKYGCAKTSFSVMDVTNLAFKNSVFDQVLALEVVEHFCESDSFLCEVTRALKDSGMLLLSTPNKVFHQRDEKGLGYDFPYHVNLMGFRDLSRILCHHFSSVKIWGTRTKRSAGYSFFRLLDFLNLRLFLTRKHRQLAKRAILRSNETLDQSNDRIELRSVHLWNSHTFQSFFAVCQQR